MQTCAANIVASGQGFSAEHRLSVTSILLIVAHVFPGRQYVWSAVHYDVVLAVCRCTPRASHISRGRYLAHRVIPTYATYPFPRFRNVKNIVLLTSTASIFVETPNFWMRTCHIRSLWFLTFERTYILHAESLRCLTLYHVNELVIDASFKWRK